MVLVSHHTNPYPDPYTQQPAPDSAAFNLVSQSIPSKKPPFYPAAPHTLEEAGLNITWVEELVFKLLLGRGEMPGREIAVELCLPFAIMNPVLCDLKNRLFLAHRSTHGMGDFIYMLSEQGRTKGLMAMEFSAYVGPAPVLFKEYLACIDAQSIRTESPGEAELRAAFSDILLDPELFNTLGPAVNSGRGMFLYGAAGNGKTTIAERISRCFHHEMWIPQVLLIDGQIVKLYDPQCHDRVYPGDSAIAPDPRWVCIKRPVVVVGGELVMESLEIQYNPLVKYAEAPLQLKANGGVFLIDDFGRQRIHHIDLLNRWIVPLEKRVDYLTLPNGKKIEVPFDELIIFSTNLDPASLVDDAFLRRTPYKIHVTDPTESAFRSLFEFLAPRYGIPYNDAMITYLIETHYRDKRPFRSCQARDILEQVVNACSYRKIPPILTEELLDAACRNYFAAMGNQPDI